MLHTPSRIVLLALAVLTATVACNGSRPPGTDASVNDATDPDGAAPPTSTEGYCRAVGERICRGMEQCGCRYDGRPYTAEGCVDARTSACVAALGTRIEPDLAAGRAAFHAPSVGLCLADLDAMVAACTVSESGLPASCDRSVMDTAAVGAACTVTGGGTAFCAGGAGVCAIVGERRVCTALPGADAPCVQGACAQGLVCDDSTCRAPGGTASPCTTNAACMQGLVCTLARTCGAPAQAGGACADAAQCAQGLRCTEGMCAQGTATGSACSGPSECGSGRACSRAPETRVCADPGVLGAACTEGSCAAGLACEQGMCATLPGDGAPCLGGTRCAPGFTCIDGERVCRPLPGSGAMCAGGERFCADGFGCDTNTNTCQPGPGAGGECLINPPEYVCAQGFGCNFGSEGSRCVALGAAGASCTTDRTCVPETFCEPTAMRCTTRRSAGGACPNGTECAPGLTCATTAMGPVCTALPERGAPCQTACAAGLACTGAGGQCAPALCAIP